MATPKPRRQSSGSARSIITTNGGEIIAQGGGN
jgi:hypothetical protein